MTKQYLEMDPLDPSVIVQGEREKLLLLFSTPKNSEWSARLGDSPAPSPHIVLAASAKPHLWWTTNPQLFGPQAGSEQLDHSCYNYPYPLERNNFDSLAHSSRVAATRLESWQA
jgi:hypothetical protein